MASKRFTASDFQRDVGSRTNGARVWSAVINSDNTTYAIKLTAGGVTTTVFSKVFWPGASGAPTDSNPGGDKVVIWSNDDPSVQSEADVQVFLNSLN